MYFVIYNFIIILVSGFDKKTAIAQIRVYR
jgi:hypothetical protein